MLRSSSSGTAQAAAGQPANRWPTAKADADSRAYLRPARLGAAGQYLQDTRRQSIFFEYTREPAVFDGATPTHPVSPIRRMGADRHLA